MEVTIEREDKSRAGIGFSAAMLETLGMEPRGGGKVIVECNGKQLDSYAWLAEERLAPTTENGVIASHGTLRHFSAQIGGKLIIKEVLRKGPVQ
jgi:hypothetical protein